VYESGELVTRWPCLMALGAALRMQSVTVALVLGVVNAGLTGFSIRG
jgi:hypothetical protein